MFTSLWKRGRGGFDAQLAEAQSRVDAAPEGACVTVKPHLMRYITVPPQATDDQPQYITVDTGIHLIKRALVFGNTYLERGMVRTIETGPTCEKCGQSGLAYRNKGKTEILVCSHVERGLMELFYQRRMAVGCYDDYPTVDPMPPMPNTLVIADVPIKSIECGRHLKMTLRMRYCWFD